MILGPIGIGLSLIAPFLPAIARATGLVTEESSKLTKTFKQLDEQQKALANRFDIQTTAIKNTELSYVETRKAVLAYNTTNLETFKLINQSSKDLAAFQRNLSGLGASWEGFKSIFGLDRESKVIKSQTESIKDSIEAAILVDDQGMLDIFKDAAIETEGFSVAVKSAENAQTAFDNAQKNLNTTGTTRSKLLNQHSETLGTNKQLTG